MSNYDGYADARPASWRRALLVGLATLVALVLIWTVGFMSRDQAQPTPGAQADLPAEGSSATAVRLVEIPAGTVPVSGSHGPRRQNNGAASGFSHDELGAVIAAVNLAVRTSSAAGPDVYEPTITSQGYGDPAAMLERNRAQRPGDDAPTRPGAIRFRAVHYRVIGGDPTGESVVISLLAETEQAQQLGGLARLDVTLRWVDGDWRVLLPTARPLLHPSARGYTLLARQP